MSAITTTRNDAMWTPWTPWTQWQFHRSRSKALVVGSLQIGRLVQFQKQPERADTIEALERCTRLPAFSLVLGDESAKPFTNKDDALKYAAERVWAKP